MGSTVRNNKHLLCSWKLSHVYFLPGERSEVAYVVFLRSEVWGQRSGIVSILAGDQFPPTAWQQKLAGTMGTNTRESSTKLSHTTGPRHQDTGLSLGAHVMIPVVMLLEYPASIDTIPATTNAPDEGVNFSCETRTISMTRVGFSKPHQVAQVATQKWKNKCVTNYPSRALRHLSNRVNKVCKLCWRNSLRWLGGWPRLYYWLGVWSSEPMVVGLTAHGSVFCMLP